MHSVLLRVIQLSYQRIHQLELGLLVYHRQYHYDRHPYYDGYESNLHNTQRVEDVSSSLLVLFQFGLYHQTQQLYQYLSQQVQNVQVSTYQGYQISLIDLLSTTLDPTTPLMGMLGANSLPCLSSVSSTTNSGVLILLS